MGTDSPDETDDFVAPRPKKRFTTGLFALALLVVNAMVTVGSYFASGTGVDSAIGFAQVFLVITFPGLLYSVYLGIAAIIKGQGRLPGAIALAIAGSAVAASVYGFVSTQMF